MNHKEMMAQLKKRLAGRFKQPAVEKSAPAVVKEFLQVVIDELVENGKVAIPGLGILKVVERPVFSGNTPEGKTVNRPVAKIIRLLPGKIVKGRIN